ncbi:DUF7144 family membrane protein [Dactylosporangium sp. CA-139114]|uniref:DUF7144 family membrane protein n=1 Tax=Dactylosporangium sp. CA-139114 TaxID=3239931 RepID=UPI003D951CF9
MADTGTSRSPAQSSAWFGWIMFAGVLLAVIGVLNILEGLVALLRRQVAFIDGDSLVVVDLSGLGIVMVVFGALLVLCGAGLLLRNRVARMTAIVVVALHALSQIGWLGAYPVWSLLMITLDVIVLYALTVHWVPPEITAPAPAGGVHRADHQPRETDFPLNQPRPTTTHAHEADSPVSDRNAAAPHRAEDTTEAPTSGPGTAH